MAEMTDDQRAEVELFEDEGELSDGLFAKAVLVGAGFGVPLVGLVVWAAFSASDVSISNEGIIGLAVWSALWAGLLIGGVLGVGFKLLNLEKKIHGEDH